MDANLHLESSPRGPGCLEASLVLATKRYRSGSPRSTANRARPPKSNRPLQLLAARGLPGSRPSLRCWLLAARPAPRILTDPNCYLVCYPIIPIIPIPFGCNQAPTSPLVNGTALEGTTCGLRLPVYGWNGFETRMLTYKTCLRVLPLELMDHDLGEMSLCYPSTSVGLRT